MPFKIQDLSDFAEQNTLVFRVPVYAGGEPTGSSEDWSVPPVNLETEIALRAIQDAQLKELTSSLQKAAGQEGEEEEEPEVEEPPAIEENPRVMADFWAPVVALYVKSPKLDAEVLRKDYPGQLLRKVGESAQHFFLYGSLPQEATPMPTPLPKPKRRRK